MTCGRRTIENAMSNTERDIHKLIGAFEYLWNRRSAANADELEILRAKILAIRHLLS